MTNSQYFYGQKQFEDAFSGEVFSKHPKITFLTDGALIEFGNENELYDWLEDFCEKYEEWANYTFPEADNIVKFLYY